jgi:hypothetical protein
MKLSHLCLTLGYLVEDQLFGFFPWVGLVGEVTIGGSWEVNWSRKTEFPDYTQS